MVLLQGDRQVNEGSSNFLKKTQLGLDDDVRKIYDNNEPASNILCRNKGADLRSPNEGSTRAPEGMPPYASGMFPASHNYEHPACHFSLDMSSADGRFSFTQCEHDYRKNNPLPCGLLDISNFENVDATFRNCDLAFGQGNGTVGELLSFSPFSSELNGSEDAYGRALECSSFDFRSLSGTSMQLGLQDSLLPENDRMTAVTGTSARPSLGPSTYDMARSIIQEQASYGSVGSEIKSSTIQASNENCSTEHGDIDKVSLRRRPENRQSSEGKGKDRFSECVSSSTSCESEQIQWNADQKHEPHYFQLLDPNLFWLPAASCNMQTFSTDEQMEGVLPSHGDLFMQTTSRIMCETDESSSFTFRAPDQFSTHGTECLERYPVLYNKPPDVILKEMTEKPCLGQNLHAALTMKDQSEVLTSRTAVLKQNQKSPKRTRGDSKLEDLGFVVTAISGESSTSQNSCVASSSGDMLVKDVCFQQLQEVMDQLDIRSKLCIRDGLYHLAKSAEQRHKFAGTNSESRECKREVQGLEDLMSRCTGHTSLRTLTNPIYRTVAHLLFNRPSDSMTARADYVMSPKPYITS
ncbi:uncharacterized protein [Typha latifolia]|uniref:uncharacterized protein isoform X1 n=2 Tax=Typha latifolia TaxID=4733 RepID=UPI003C2EEA3D